MTESDSRAEEGPAPGGGARLAIMAAIVLGVAVATGVVGYFGFSKVFAALGAIGWRGFGFLCVYTALPFCLLGTAWFVLAGRASPGQWGIFVWARMVRDAGAELLPLSHLSGFLLGARAAMLQGFAPTRVLSTEVVDVTTELIAQLGFTGLGLSLLAMRLGSGSAHNVLIGAGLIGLALTAVGAVAFITLQRRGMGLVEGLARRFLPAAAAGTGEIGAALEAIYRRPGRVILSVVIHMSAWIASAAGAWGALRLAGVPIGLGSILAIESLVAAARSAAVFAPAGVGVQEATYAVLGPLFGLGAEMSLALSLIKRARDLAIGVPTLIVWQALESRRLIDGRRGGVGLAGGLD